MDKVGVAYRIMRRSRFRQSATTHPEMIASSLMRNAEATSDLSGYAPFAFSERSAAYEWELTRVKRLLGALVSAVEAGDEVGTTARRGPFRNAT